jgi:hypothetical protein
VVGLLASLLGEGVLAVAVALGGKCRSVRVVFFYDGWQVVGVV